MQKFLGPLQVPFGTPLSLAMVEFGRGRPVLSVVAGLHGNGYNGVYTCHLLIDWLKRQEQRRGDYQLRGRVRVLPAANPPALLVANRHWPFDHTDLDRVFPGYLQGETTQRLAGWLFEQVRGSDCCVQLQASEEELREWPRVQVQQVQTRALDLAKSMGLPVVQVHRSAPGEPGAGLQGTLTHNLLQAGVDALNVRGGAIALEPEIGEQLLVALVRLIVQLGIASGPEPPPPGAVPQLVADAQIQAIHCRRAGLFVPQVACGEPVRAGGLLGQILDPLRGEKLEDVCTEVAGVALAVRHWPVALEGSLVARLLVAPV